MEIKKRQTVPHALMGFAQLLGTEIKNSRLEIPKEYGRGYCAGFVFNEHIRMLIFDYELNTDVVIPNPDIDISQKMILFKFQNILLRADAAPAGKPQGAIPSVLIATRRMSSDLLIPIHTHTATINIEVDANYLREWFEVSGNSTVLMGLLQNEQALLFEQIIYPSLQKIVDEIISESVGETFELFFLRIKAEELVCRLLMELEKRNEKHLFPLNSQDIQSIYKIKSLMLDQLNTPPVVAALSIAANMSPTKLKRLFKQIFGNSIYSYYQEFRIKEAARLLKEENVSVSEAGYRLGFTNLSHFSRVFNEEMGMKPKQYSRV